MTPVLAVSLVLPVKSARFHMCFLSLLIHKRLKLSRKDCLGWISERSRLLLVEKRLKIAREVALSWKIRNAALKVITKELLI